MECAANALFTSRWRPVGKKIVLQTSKGHMNSRIKVEIIVFACGLYAVAGFAQGSFQNLDFESATLAPIPSGQSGGMVTIASGMPGWNVYIGNEQETSVLHNNVTAGSGSVDIWGPQFSVIEGNYTAVLQTGIRGTAAIAENGSIPVSAQSLLFKSWGDNNIRVAFSGQPISMVPIQTTSSYTLYAGDISQYAGLSGELRFSTLSSIAYLDSIQFSAVPEPETYALCLFGIAGLFGCRKWFKATA